MTAEKRKYIINALERYWPNKCDLIEKMHMARFDLPESEEVPAKGNLIEVPDWAGKAAVDGCLLVPEWSSRLAGNNWQEVDWLMVCFWYLNCLSEKEYERRYGPAHSYSYRLKGWDERLWQRAWVNRIAIFLRAWCAQQMNRDENELFGPLCNPEIILTHDVDAICKTVSIRLKQTLFNGFNVLRSLLKGNILMAVRSAKKAFRFLLSRDNYWCFDEILQLESSYGLKSIFNVYAGKPGSKRNVRQIVLDPAYDISESELESQLKLMDREGWEIGLHQSFFTWNNQRMMKEEKDKLEKVIEKPVSVCRQHWLRFSFNDTWVIQDALGFSRDATLGFNDRPAFRNSAALAFQPWNEDKQQALRLVSLPMVLMDSHFFDYNQYSDQDRIEEIMKWLDEIKEVGGQATMIWHQRVMSKDYGWGDTYKWVLQRSN